MSFDNRNRNNRDVAVALVSYSLVTNTVIDVDVYPTSPFGGTTCDIQVGDDLASAIACLLQDRFKLVPDIAATGSVDDVDTAIGHYTFIRQYR